MYRNELGSKDIKSKAFSLVKKIAFNNVLDIRVRKRIKDGMYDKYIL